MVMSFLSTSMTDRPRNHSGIGLAFPKEISAPNNAASFLCLSRDVSRTIYLASAKRSQLHGALETLKLNPNKNGSKLTYYY